MLRVKYNLITKNKSISPVQMSINWNGNRIQKNIGYSVETKYWDFNKHRVKPNHKNAVSFNSYLHTLESAIIEVYNEKLNFHKDVSKNVIKKELINLLSKGINTEYKHLSVIEVMNEFIDTYRPNGKKPAQKTIDSYINTRNKLERYMRDRKVKLDFDDLDNDFYEDFVQFLYEKNNNDNTIGTNIRKIKTFMSWSLEKKYHTSEDFRKFKAMRSEALFSIALTEDEIRKLHKLKLNHQDLEFARLFMLVNCHVGMRYSDLMDVIRERTITGNELRIFQVKTRQPVKLYLNDNVIEMIRSLKELNKENYDRKVLNKNLKAIGKLIGMNKIESSTKLVGNKRITIEKPRWQLFTTHVGRRTFATTAAMKGMPLHVIKQYTGHKSLDSLEKYLNASNFDDREILENLFNLE